MNDRPALLKAEPDPHHASTGYSFPFLDGLRGIAILSVVIYHCPTSNPESWAEKILFAGMSAGYLGVSLFFVISGFLISLAVFSIKNRQDVFNYALRRAGKILPPFYLTILVLATWYLTYLDPALVLQAAAAFATTYAHFTTAYLWFNSPCWTLFIEIHFYILLPLVFLLLRKITRHAAIGTWLLFLLVPAIVRCLTDFSPGQNYLEWFTLYNLFPRSFDCFSWGILFAVIYERSRTRPISIPGLNLIPYLGLILLVLSYAFVAYCRYRISGFNLNTNREPTIDHTIGNYMAGAAGLLLLFLALSPHSALSAVLNFAPLRYIGLISYEWYLIHVPMIHVFWNISSYLQDYAVWPTRTIGPMVASFLLASAIYHFFSRPILNKVKRYANSTR